VPAARAISLRRDQAVFLSNRGGGDEGGDVVFDVDSALPTRAQSALMAGLRSGMSADTLAAYVRWFQLETWLRQLVHLEMSAAYGRAWTSHLRGNTVRRAELNATNAYMLSPDEESLLAYGDVSELFSLIEANWELFSPALVTKVRWCGWADELRAIRNRIAHARRPHADDVLRLEQILRNIEPGAKATLKAYDSTFDEIEDPQTVAGSWVGANPPWHDIARHAAGRYQTSFQLAFSRRPWATPSGAVLGVPGILVHAQWRIGEGYVTPRSVWPDLLRQGFDPALIVHYVQDLDSCVDIIFSGMDPPRDVAHAIRGSFHAILRNIVTFDDDAYAAWKTGAESLDPRCHIDDAFAHADRLALFSVFGAGPVTP
jgi:Swt1-like HEPN